MVVSKAGDRASRGQGTSILWNLPLHRQADEWDIGEVLLWLLAPEKAEIRVFSASADHAPAVAARERRGGQIPKQEGTVGSHTAPKPRRGGVGGLDALTIGAESNPALSPAGCQGRAH